MMADICVCHLDVELIPARTLSQFVSALSIRSSRNPLMRPTF